MNLKNLGAAFTLVTCLAGCTTTPPQIIDRPVCDEKCGENIKALTRLELIKEYIKRIDAGDKDPSLPSLVTNIYFRSGEAEQKQLQKIIGSMENKTGQKSLQDALAHSCLTMRLTYTNAGNYTAKCSQEK